MTLPTATPLDSYEEWRIQILAYLAGELSPDEVRELSAALRASPELRDEFVTLAKQQVLLEEIGEAALAELPARTPVAGASPGASPSPANKFCTVVRKQLRYAVAAMFLIGALAGGIAYYRSRPGAVATGGGPGGLLPEPAAAKQYAGVKQGPQTLESGVTQLQLENGVTLLVEGPARFRIDADLKVLLDSGKLTAKVPKNAHGFTVLTPTARVVDLGTEFGVEVHSDGSTYTAVFSGTVQVYALNAPAPLDTVTTLTRDQAANIRADTAVVAPGEYVAEGFVREIAQARHPIPLFNTGFGLKMGDADPHWRIVKEDFDPTFAPQQAFVHHFVPKNYLYDPTRSQWIALRGEPKTDPPGKYTFKTSVDLTGFDPTTVLIHAHVEVDDGLTDILINGKSTGCKLAITPVPSIPEGNFTLRGAFHEGINDVEFIVENSATVRELNPVKLQVEWKGTAAHLTDK